MGQTQIGDSVYKLNGIGLDATSRKESYHEWINRVMWMCDHDHHDHRLGSIFFFFFFPLFVHVFVLNYALGTSNQIAIKWCFLALLTFMAVISIFLVILGQYFVLLTFSFACYRSLWVSFLFCQGRKHITMLSLHCGWSTSYYIPMLYKSA